MSALLSIAALMSCSASAHMLHTEGMSLMQSRLRGSKASVTVTSVASPEQKDSSGPSEPSEQRPAAKGQRYSDDDELCTAEGLTPGVCALGWLARQDHVTAAKKHHHRGAISDCDQQESTDRLERALIAEIEAGLAGSHTGFDEARLQTLQQELEPLYVTLPHEKPLADIEAGLGLASARYLLHQHFLRQHSWYVRGLNPAGDGRKPPEHKEALRSRVAGHLLEVLEKKVGKAGLNLKTLATFVATLEHLLHGDERERLKQAWAVHDLSIEDTTDGEGLLSVLQIFAAHYIFEATKAESGYAMTLDKGRQEVKQISKGYGGWSSLDAFMQKQVEERNAVSGQDLGFEDAAKAADNFLKFFRDVSGSMCKDMDKVFTALPGGQAGRVSLADMKRDGHFQESSEYLRAAGILDESDPTKPYVLLPNYMLGSSNCDGTTSFYDLCCPSACEGRKASLEEALANSNSDHVSTIKGVLQKQLASPLSEDLVKKLEQIAEANSGHVMMHGQDFAWLLHGVFPRECPRPLDADFRGTSGNSVPDAAVEFQASAESMFSW